MNPSNAQLLHALMSLRESLSEMALILSDYQFDVDIAMRRAAKEQADQMLVRVTVQSPLPDRKLE